MVLSIGWVLISCNVSLSIGWVLISCNVSLLINFIVEVYLKKSCEQPVAMI